ncbi:hypothetical protein ABMA28_007284 [Loxostege sticticalis]|uniref:Endonuclease n=1 Tax=Loxostege sticticalis TaxID=481309 RepID=A0ABD0TQ88_LOXSC
MDGKGDDLKRLKNKRRSCKATITRIQNFVMDPVALTGAGIDMLEARRDKLVSTLKEYEENNIDIQSLDEDDRENEEEVESQYFKVLSKLQEALKALKRCETQSNTNISNSKLPSIEIASFDGKDFSKYQPFMDLFTALIDNNKILSNVQKLFYLRKYLQDEALSVIINLPITNESYPEAISLLNRRYNNKSRLIANHLNYILDLQVIQKGTAAALRTFTSEVQQQLYALKNLGQPTDKWDMLLISILIKKLDSYTVRAYHLDRASPDKLPTLDEFFAFIEKRAIALEDSSPQNVSKPNNYSKHFKAQVTNFAINSKNKKQFCIFCNKMDHLLFMCPKFKLASVHERLDFVTSHKLCTTCLNSHTDKCKFNFKCKSCKQNHNTLLHQDKQSEEPIVSLHSNNKLNETILLPTIQVKLIDKYGQEIFVKALLDSGSQASVVTESLVTQLGLSPMTQNTNIIGIGNNSNKIDQCVNIFLQSCVHDIKLKVKCHIVKNITTKLPQHYVNFSKLSIPKNVMLADKDFFIPSEICLLLGADVYFKTILDGNLRLESGPMLQNTLFGYVVGGNVKCQKSVSETSNVTLVTNFAISDSNNNLENIMENFWLSEKMPEGQKKITSEFQKTEQCFKDSVTIQNNRFHVDMPLKSNLNELQLGDSFSVALQRFYALEKKFNTNPSYFEQYKTFINEYLELGHAKMVDISIYDVNSDPVYFLSHHAVLNEASKTTKLRVVFNGSMKSKNKVSLNDVMLNGPIVQNELFDILLLFRTYKYTLLCDIEKMFRQVYINKHHTPLQNILWRDDPTKPISCLQLQTVTYGLKASTFLSTRCLVELALLHQDSYPYAADAILKNTYVDDIICGADNLELISSLKNQLIDLLKLGSFKLHKWCSNVPRALEDIPKSDQFFDQVDLSRDNIIKTLGLKYNILTDSLTFSCPPSDGQELLTKRNILAFIGRMYDPLGLIGPIIVRAKLFMQELWCLKIDWDSIIPNKQYNEWVKFTQDLSEMKTIQTPRGIVSGKVSSVELVGYCDASFKAIGCCLYLRIIYEDNRVQVNLLCSKSRIAPKNKSLTIPNLELNSALLLSQLAHRVQITLKNRFPIKVILNSDSQIVLSWIDNSENKKGVYVANRIKEIKSLTENYSWFYVKSSENPADLLSRGVCPQSLQDNKLWWHGPQYISNFDHQFIKEPTYFSIPTNSMQMHGNIEQTVALVVNTNSNVLDDTNVFDKYSDITKLQRVIAYILRFQNNCLNSNNKTLGFLSPLELKKSMMIIVRYAQSNSFSSEIQNLSSNKDIKTGIGNLHPFLDQDNLLRVGGRLQNAINMTYEKKHPAILPKSNNITHMIIQREHLRLLHAGPKLVLSSLSQRYWLVNGIREVKKVTHSCIKCFRTKAEVAKQLMGSLPSQRITPSRPFLVTGVDFCGPFDLKAARIRKPLITKSYIAVFVCFSTKAIHAELVSSLTTEAFLACLKRFVSRKGLPTHIYCDNAATFKGASNYFKDLCKLNNYCLENCITFKNIPSHSPEFGGLWEAGVKSIKYHLKRIVGNVSLTYEELYTVITQIESVLNSRPLLPMTSDVTDLNYLTPGHFLIGTSLTGLPEPDLSETNINRLKFWDICTKLKQEFWKVWSRDYLTQLQNRPKWKYGHANIKTGDLVIVKMSGVPSMNWPMARVVKVFPGTDGKVRVAEIMMGANRKTYLRSYHKLCPLPLN